MALDFKNAYIRLRPDTKAPKDSGWGEADAETFTRLDAAVVKAWVAKGRPVGILTGPRSGHFTVDVDPDKGGLDSYDRLAKEHAAEGGWGDTNTVTTPSGGFHLNYRWPTDIDVRNSAGSVFGPGIDVRGAFGQRAAPPSPGYIEVNPGAPYAPAPAWVLDLLRKKASKRVVGPSVAYEEVEKVEIPQECCEALSAASANDLLRSVKALAGLPENKTLLIEGKQRGWELHDGFFVLACQLVKIARWPYQRKVTLGAARSAFLKRSVAFDRAEHTWDRAVNAVEADGSAWYDGEQHWLGEHSTSTLPLPSGDDEEPPYPCGLNTEPYQFSKEVLNRHFRNEKGVLTLRLREDDETFWLWEDERARYVAVSDLTVGAIVGRKLADAQETAEGENGLFTRPVRLKSSNIVEVVRNLRTLTLTSKHGGGALLPSAGGVPFLNGWLNVSTRELLPVGPERDIRWNVPLAYDPEDGGTTVEWTKFLKSIGWGPGTEEHRLLRQWFGYVLSGSKAQQKAMVLIGPTRSGKGIVLKIASAMLGDGAVGTQMDALADKNGLENVIGRGLVTVGDARFSFKTDKGLAGRLLSLIGDDEMTVNAKYKNLVSTRLDARLMLATNEPPTFTEASDALARRFLMLQTTESFLGREDFGLEKRLMKELPGIVKWALAGLDDLAEVGNFVQTSTGHELQEQLVRDSAPVRVFIEEMCEFGEYRIQKQALYDEYVFWARQNGISFILSNAQFYRDLNTAFPGRVKTTKLKIGGTRVPHALGIRIAK